MFWEFQVLLRYVCMFDITCCHIICALTSHSALEIYADLILDRWHATLRGRVFEASSRQIPSNMISLRMICNENFDLVDGRVSPSTFVEASLKDTLIRLRTNYLENTTRNPIPSITMFESPSHIPIEVGYPKVVKNKGSGKCGRPPKSSEKFISSREGLRLKARSYSLWHSKRGCLEVGKEGAL